jgi:hypothetical protein
MDILPRLPGGAPGIAKRTVKDQISDKLAYMILTGLLRPGDELPSERRRAGTLGVARESVRAAIAVLQARRMIEVSQGAHAGRRDRASRCSTIRWRPGGLKTAASTKWPRRDAVEEQVIRLAAKRISARPSRGSNTCWASRKACSPIRSASRFRSRVPFGALCRVRQRPAADVVNDFYDYARLPPPGHAAPGRDRAQRRRPSRHRRGLAGARSGAGGGGDASSSGARQEDDVAGDGELNWDRTPVGA